MTTGTRTATTNSGADWHLGEPSQGLHVWAATAGIELRPDHGEIPSTAALKRFQPLTRLGRLLPSLIPQLLELGIASLDSGRIAIAYEELVGIEERGIDALDGYWRWSPFSVELQSTGWLQDASFGYFVRFYLGSRPVDLHRRGCFVRRGEEIYRLDHQSYSLLQAIESFSQLPPEARVGTGSMLHFARIKGLAEEVGAQLDHYLTKERVLIPARVGLDVIVDDEQRITFVPKVDGVPDEAIRDSFLALDDVDDCYACATSDGGRIRVILSAPQRDVLRRMQTVRHVGGAERAEIMRNPYSVFDGVAEGVDVDLKEFGPRVKGVGDFPFVARPYLQRSATGIFDDREESSGYRQKSRFTGGLECMYADGTTERVTFKSRDDLLRLNANATEAHRLGKRQTEFGGKSIVIDQQFVDSLRGLVDRVTSSPRPDKESKADPRRYVLIYTNEDKLEYEEECGDEILNPDVELPSALAPTVQLKKHQRDGVEWLQRNFRLRRHGCLLADDMGLGKTLQTLIFLAWLIEKGALSDAGADPERAPWNPILIVAPVILLENEVWINDMKRFFVADGDIFQPWLSLHGTTLQKYRRPSAAGRETMIGEPVLDLERLRQNRVILTNYETITNYQHSFARMRNCWTAVVTDEAQEYKTPSTKVSHALKSLDPRFRIACTGTPVETRLLDVWNIFDFLQPGQLLGSSSEFSKRFERGADADESIGSPSETQVQELRRALRYGTPNAFVLRRNKAEILSDLPMKHERKLRCGLSDVQRNWHLEILSRARKGGNENHPFSLITQLMRIYQHPALVPSFEPMAATEAVRLCPKLECLVDCLEQVRSKFEKALIFTRSLDMQQLLQSVLQERFGIEADIVNGATPRKGGTRGSNATRQSVLRRFKEGSGFDVLILSPDVAGIGLTLVEANHVIHYGRWWNPAKESQATDRAYRIGQTRNVHVYQLIAEDPLHEFVSFDEKLDALIERRRTLAADFLAPMPSDEELEAELLRDVLGQDAEPVASGGLSPLGSEDVRRLSWERFEALTACLWQQPGAQVFLTPKAGDEGVDVIAFRDRTVELVQCKHTLWEAVVDADVIAELIQAFDGYRAKRFRRAQGRLALRCTLVTNGKLSTQFRRAARERDIEVCGGNDLLHLLDARRCTAADIEAANSQRLASMRDVQAKIDRLVDD